MGSTKYPLVAPPQGGTPNLPSPGQPAPMGPDEYKVPSKANVTAFNFSNVDPPSPLYLQRDDLITLTAACSVTPVTVRFIMRFLRAPEPKGGQPSDGGVGKTPGVIIQEGYVETIVRDIILPANSNQSVNNVSLAEGYLLGIGVSCSPNQEPGTVFARAFLNRGATGFTNVSTPLFSDYVTGIGSAGWPNGRSITPADTQGVKESLVWGTPAAGADLSFTLFTTRRLRIETCFAIFTASATVANRNIQIVITDGVNTLFIGTSPVVVTAGQVVQIVGTGGNTITGIITTNIMIPLPTPLILTGGWQIKTVTQNIQAGDQWSAAFLNVAEFMGGI